jgi:hypothetical protein
LDAGLLRRLYVQQGQTMAEIADVQHCCGDWVRWALIAAGIPRRPAHSREQARRTPITAAQLVTSPLRMRTPRVAGSARRVCRPVLGEVVQEFVGDHRPAEQESLGAVGSESAEVRELGGGFDAFGDDDEVKDMGEVDDR